MSPFFTPQRLTGYADLIVDRWQRHVCPSRRRNPRQKEHVHRIVLAPLPDGAGLAHLVKVREIEAWTAANLRVPFLVEFEGTRPVFKMRCHVEAMAVKLRFG